MKEETSNLPQNEAMQYDPVLAVVNYNAVGSWLEPYIGHSLNLIKRGVKVTWFEINYGKLVKRKADSIFFNYR